MRIRKVALAAIAACWEAGHSPSQPRPAPHCPAQTGNSGSATGTNARVGAHPEGQPAYDRLVLDFAGPAPHWTAIPKSSAVFTLQPKGETVKLLGNAGIRIDLPGDYAGTTTDIKTGFNQLAEVRLLQNFEGVVQWGIGLNHQSCKRIFTLSNPNRLVIDVPQ